MTAQLKDLIEAVLRQWQGPLPRLHYVTDAGNHPQQFFKSVLKSMRHPRTGEKLDWSWAVDYFHAAERITTMAEALFGKGRAASSWAEKMRHWLKHKPAGVTRVLQSAQALRRTRGLKSGRTEFDAAAAYLSRYRRWMNYSELRRFKLAIGSGVTEAACKTLVSHRFKQSGMRWKRPTAQHVLDLRVLLKSNVWEHVRNDWLHAFNPCQIVNTAQKTSAKDGIPRKFTLQA